MTDLFDTEAFEERSAIKEFDGRIDRSEAERQTREEMHKCEVRDAVKRFFPNGAKAAEHFELVERKRGKEAADKLRNDVRIAWREYAIEIGSQP